MKKILLLLAVVLGGVNSAGAEEVILASNVTDGARLDFSTIFDAGGIPTDVVTFYFEDNTGENHDGWGMGGFAKASEWSVFDEEFKGKGTSWTEEYTVARIKEVVGTESGIRIRLFNGAELKKIVLNTTLVFVELKEVSYDGGGVIAASEFDGLVDNDIIKFTYTVTGDITGYEGWGIGSIGSNDDPHTCKITDLPSSALGDLTFKCTYADIKKALAKTPDGILFKVWNFGSGKCTATRKKVEIFKSCVPITIPAGKEYISFSTDAAVDFSGVSGLEAYTVSELTASSATLAKVTEAPAETGLVLKGTAGSTYSVPVKASAAAVGTNKLNAAVTETAVGANSTYVVSDGQFKKFTGTVIPAGKAYLLATDVPAGARELNLDIEGLSTGIFQVEDVKVKKDNVYYDLSGRRVLYPTKGLYVVNGKKIIVK